MSEKKQPIRSKSKDLHFYTTDERFKELAKAAIDLGINRNEFIERAIDHFIASL